MRRKYVEPDWPRLMSVEAACAYLGALDRETFLATVAPSLQAHKLPDGVLRYDRRDVDGWVDSRGSLMPKRSDQDWLLDVAGG
jgi:hypothetical protein